jgi:hypothetical protein
MSRSNLVPRRSLALLLLMLVAPHGLSGPAEAGASPPPGPVEPLTGALFGAYVKPDSGWSRDDVMASIQRLESDLGRTLDVDHHYYSWTFSIPSWKEEWDLTAGRIPMMSWGAVSTKQVNSGAFDQHILSRAEAVRALARPVFIRWFYEMDSDALAHLSRSPSSYIRAWRRIRWIFASAGAWNAVWVWCPTSWGFKDGEAPTYYPGDDYVDWVCSDGYNWAPGRKGDDWRSFPEIYDAFYEFGLARDKPMMAGEYGCQERGPGDKAAWITQARNDIQQRFPEMDALVYFDSDRDYDWRLETSASSYQAFIDMGNDPYFRPSHETLGPVDPSRFDSVLADATAPHVSGFRARFQPRRGSLRWRSAEPNADFVRLRYAARGGGGGVIVGRTPDDGRFTWRFPGRLEGRRIRLFLTAVDLAGNSGNGRTGWLRVG